MVGRCCREIRPPGTSSGVDSGSLALFTGHPFGCVQFAGSGCLVLQLSQDLPEVETHSARARGQTRDLQMSAAAACCGLAAMSFANPSLVESAPQPSVGVVLQSGNPCWNGESSQAEGAGSRGG